MMNIRINGSWKELTSGNIYTNDGWKDITRGNLRIADTWKDLGTLTSDLTASALPPSPSGARSGSGSVTTGVCTVTPNGGQSPYSYQWSALGGGVTINSANAASTTFTAIIANSEEKTSAVSCIVTDAFGATATAAATATFVSFPTFEP